MNIQIDHVVIAGKDLDEMRVGFASVGLMPDEGGQHADGQTHNALIGFEDGSYLELIAPIPGGTAPGHVWSSYMNNDAGVCAWAIRSDDIRADVEMFRQRGITVGDPVQGGRNRPDGVRLEWITAKLGDGPLGSVLPFLIQDVTPRELRVPRTKSAEGLITGITGLGIAVKDLGASGALFEKAFGKSQQVKGLSRDIDGKEERETLVFYETPITFVDEKKAEGLSRLGSLGECLNRCLLYVSNFDNAIQHFKTVQGFDATWNHYPIAWLDMNIELNSIALWPKPNLRAK